MEPVPANAQTAVPDQALLSRSTDVSNRVAQLWKEQLAKLELTDAEKARFDAAACPDINTYLDKLQKACKAYEDQSRRSKIMEWFEPFAKVVDVGTLIVSAAYPPSSLVLGGVVALLQFTRGLITYQKLTLQMLARMGRKARIVSSYEKGIYENDLDVRSTLILVYGDILNFCTKAFRFVAKTRKSGQLVAKVKDKMMVLVRDFDSHFGDDVQNFEDHLEDLESYACICYRQRMNQNQTVYQQQLHQLSTETRKHFQQDEDENLRRRQRAVNEQLEQRQRRKDKQRVLRWLCSSQMHGAYDRACDMWLEGTGSWLTSSKEFLEWKNADENDLLRIRGKPGCGKSILAAVAVNALRTEMQTDAGLNTGFAFAFLGDEDDSSKDPTNILGALARQLLSHIPSIDPKIEADYLSSGETKRPSRKEVKKALQSAMLHYKQIFLVVDGLDECRSNSKLAHREIAEDLLSLLQARPNVCVKLLVFSRPDFLIDGTLGSFDVLRSDHHNDEDLRAYVEHLFPADEKFRKECIERAQGMFQWVWLVYKSLQQPMKDAQRLERLKQIPAELPGLYNRILADIWDQDSDVRDDAFLVLLWITHGQRVLSQEEMLEAVADYRNVRKVERSSKNSSADDLVAICKNLVFIDKDKKFRFCHESVREYLEDSISNTEPAVIEYHTQKENVNERLATVCLDYLLLDNFACGPVTLAKDLVWILTKYPFFRYAAQYWGTHVPEQPSESLKERITRFIHSQSRRELSMQVYLFSFANTPDRWKEVASSNVLHILSMFGLHKIAKNIDDAPNLVQQHDAPGNTPLAFAVFGKHLEIALWLIELNQGTSGLFLNAEHRLQTIHDIISFGWISILKAFLAEIPAFINSKISDSGATPLTTACCEGTPDIVTLLLTHEANVNLEDGEGDTPLMTAIACGNADVAKLLLEHGADPRRRDRHGLTPLHMAAMVDHDTIVHALLRLHVDPFATYKGSSGCMPLHLAARDGATRAIKALTDFQPMLERKSNSGGTALHFAVAGGSTEAVELLLELGISKDATDVDGETALFLAAKAGYPNIVEKLLAWQCDLRIISSKGETAFHAAVASGEHSIVEAIVRGVRRSERRKLLNLQDAKGQTALHDAIWGYCKPDIITLLLKAGADPTINGVLDSSPLHYAATRGDKEIVRSLLNLTREPNPRNEHGHSPLHFAARVGSYEFIVELFSASADLGLHLDVDAQDVDGFSALMLSLTNGFEDVADFLVDKTSPRLPSKSGNDHIHLAAWQGYDAVLNKLVPYGALNSKGFRGRTPLWWASSKGHLEAVRLLAPLCREALNLADDYGVAPVLIGLDGGYQDIVEVLLGLGARHDVKNDYGSTLLHTSAAAGDIGMTRRLLDLGRRADDEDSEGETPFHLAIRHAQMDVLDEFVTRGFNLVDRQGRWEKSCVIYAAETGSLRMLRRLHELGAHFGGQDILGQTAAFLASSNGHLEILDFLKAHGEDFGLPDVFGDTPLICAARNGYPETTEYVIKQAPGSIHCYNKWGESALSEAVRLSQVATSKLLLQHDFNVYHRDKTGLSALEHAVQTPLILQEMLKQGYHLDLDADAIQRQIISKAIRETCDTLIQFPEALSEAESLERLQHVAFLLSAIRRVQDYDAAEVCFRDLRWPRDDSRVQFDLGCAVCNSQSSHGDEYLCKSCSSTQALCVACYEDYIDAGNQPWEALGVIRSLEKRVSPLRLATSKCTSLLDVTHAMHYFLGSQAWVEEVGDAYDKWERIYNTNDRYSNLIPPGSELIRLTKDMFIFGSMIRRNEKLDSKQREAMEERQRGYEFLRRRYRAEQEPQTFLCHGHEYIKVSDTHQKRSKVANVHLDSKTGRVTTLFLKRLAAKYDDRTWPVAQSSPHSAQHKSQSIQDIERESKLPSRESLNHPMPPAATPVSPGLSRMQVSKRSLINSAMPARRFSQVDFPSHQPKYDSIQWFPKAVRAQTLHTLMPELCDDSETSLEIEANDIQQIKDMQALANSSLQLDEPSIGSVTARPLQVIQDETVFLTEEPYTMPERPENPCTTPDVTGFPTMSPVGVLMEPLLKIVEIEEPGSAAGDAHTLSIVYTRDEDEESQLEKLEEMESFALKIADAMDPDIAAEYFRYISSNTFESEDTDSNRSEGNVIETDSSDEQESDELLSESDTE